MKLSWILTLSLAAALNLSAGTVNFATLDNGSGNFNSVGTSYSLGGFDFASSSRTMGVYTSPHIYHPLGGSANTGFTLFYAGDTLTITPSGGGSFSLNSIDLAAYGAGQNADGTFFNVTFTGYDSALNPIVSNTFAVPNFTGSPQLAHFSFSGFTDISSATVQQGVFVVGGTAWQFSNLNSDSQAAPEPSSIAYIVLGLGLWGLRRKATI